jgi:nucleotide-binding universal stress UspA family protein
MTSPPMRRAGWGSAMLSVVDDQPPGRPEPTRYRHVLVPLDGSALAAAALPTAGALAARFGADVHTISVAGSEEEADRLRTEASEHLGGGMGDGTVVVDADPVNAIHHRCAELGDCLLCMSTHGRGRLVGAVIGSVARAVVQSSTGPLVVVGPKADRPEALVRSGSVYRRPSRWPAPLSRGGIVACVDGTPASEAILPIAAAWARAFDMALNVLTVAEDMPPPLPGRSGPVRSFGLDDPEEYVAGLAERMTGTMPVAGLVVYDPISVASGIGTYVAHEPAALMALATHARAGMDRVRFGATAADIVRNATVPALVIRSHS